MDPLIALLFFAAWTLLTLLFSVGMYRWSRILTGRVEISRWKHHDLSVGGDFYARAMRAHGNCVENLPVFASIVVVYLATGASGSGYSILAACVVVARVLQTLVHLGFVQTNRVVAFRFSFFLVQALAMLGMVGLLISHWMAVQQ